MISLTGDERLVMIAIGRDVIGRSFPQLAREAPAGGEHLLGRAGVMRVALHVLSATTVCQPRLSAFQCSATMNSVTLDHRNHGAVGPPHHVRCIGVIEPS
jgi:hypothetical protein